jgi:hypothetical protein
VNRPLQFQLQAAGANVELGGCLAEYLRAVEGPIQRYLRALAIGGEAVEIGHRQALFRTRFTKSPIICRQQTRDRRATDLGDKGEGARLIRGRAKNGAHADTRNILRQQQIALQCCGGDGLWLGQLIEEAQHLHASRPDISIELDVGDMPLGDPKMQHTGIVTHHGHRGQRVAVIPVAAQQSHAGRFDLCQRNGGPGESLHRLGHRRGRVNGNAFDDHPRYDNVGGGHGTAPVVQRRHQRTGSHTRKLRWKNAGDG